MIWGNTTSNEFFFLNCALAGQYLEILYKSLLLWAWVSQHQQITLIVHLWRRSHLKHKEFTGHSEGKWKNPYPIWEYWNAIKIERLVYVLNCIDSYGLSSVTDVAHDVIKMKVASFLFYNQAATFLRTGIQL